MKKYVITIHSYNKDVLDLILEHLYRKKILKKIFDKNDKSDYPYVIIQSSILKSDLKRILSRKFNRKFKLG